MGWILHNPLFVIALSYTINIISPQSPARKTVFSVRMESAFHWSISVTVFHTVRMALMKHTVVCMLYFQENAFITLASKFGFYKCERKIMNVFLTTCFNASVYGHRPMMSAPLFPLQVREKLKCRPQLFIFCLNSLHLITKSETTCIQGESIKYHRETIAHTRHLSTTPILKIIL